MNLLHDVYGQDMSSKCCVVTSGSSGIYGFQNPIVVSRVRDFPTTTVCMCRVT